ncbi:MAG: hypothetical protein ACOC2C_06760 [Cyclonatronaceae bacterium]
MNPRLLLKKGLLLAGVMAAGFVSLSVAGALLSEPEHAPPDLEQLFGEKESFHYEVRYGFFNLGDMYVSMADTLVNEQAFLHIEALIESNSGIPLMSDKRYSYNSLLARNDSTAYGQYFWVDKLHKDLDKAIEYRFDYEQAKVYSSIVEEEIRDTLDLIGPADGGMALFFNGRIRAGTDSEQRHPIYIDNTLEYITITNTLERDVVNSDVLGDDTEVFISYGAADINGPFGFSGDFVARYATGPRRIPVLAKADVWIGNVSIRLKEYQNPALEE